MQCDITSVTAHAEMPQEAAAIEADLLKKNPALDVKTIRWFFEWACQMNGNGQPHTIVGLSLCGRDGRKEAFRRLNSRPASFDAHLIEAAKPKAPLTGDDTVIELLHKNGAIQKMRLKGGYTRMKGGKDKYRALALEDPENAFTTLYQLNAQGGMDFFGGFHKKAREGFEAARPGDIFTWSNIRMRKLNKTEIDAMLGGHTRFLV